jgi:hypothetical protein
MSKITRTGQTENSALEPADEAFHLLRHIHDLFATRAWDPDLIDEIGNDIVLTQVCELLVRQGLLKEPHSHEYQDAEEEWEEHVRRP